MSDDKWEDLGAKFDVLNDTIGLVPGVPDLGADHVVKDTETGELHTVVRHPNQTVGEAIEKGQFKKDS